MTTLKRDFNKDAASWDDNPGRVKVAESIFNSLKKNFKFSADMDVMDFGCGTGLLSIQILPHVRSVTGTDSSVGMLEVLNSKIALNRLSGISTQLIDIDKGESLTGSFDLVTASMTMHHIKDTAVLLKQFYQIIKPGGYLCVADLDPDDGKFHENNDGVFHKGFNRDEMKSMFKSTGFDETEDFTAAEISKPDKDGNIRKFTVFLIIGKKN